MKYVYCLTRGWGAGHEPPILDPSPLGLSGARVHHVSFGGISALISDVHPDQIADNVQNAQVHQQVVDAALRFSRSIVPCRFGSWFSDDSSILILMEEHYERLDALLTKVEGKMEVGIQALFHRAAALETPKVEESGESLPEGASYLFRKKEQSDAIKELSEEADQSSRRLSQAMSAFWSDVKMQKRLTKKGLLLSLCYLVEQQKLSHFKDAYQRFKRQNPDLKLLYTGPWPPYSFADIDLRKDLTEKAQGH